MNIHHHKANIFTLNKMPFVDEFVQYLSAAGHTALVVEWSGKVMKIVKIKTLTGRQAVTVVDGSIERVEWGRFLCFDDVSRPNSGEDNTQKTAAMEESDKQQPNMSVDCDNRQSAINQFINMKNDSASDTDQIFRCLLAALTRCVLLMPKHKTCALCIWEQ